MNLTLAKMIAFGLVVISADSAVATDLENPVTINGSSAIYQERAWGTTGSYFSYLWGDQGFSNFFKEGVSIGEPNVTAPPSKGLLVKGRTGIGVLAPKSELHVSGPGTVAETTISPDGTDETARLRLCQDSECNNSSYLSYDGVRNSLFLYFDNGIANDRIALKVEHHANSAARVGINVPVAHDIKRELEVNGRILAEEIEVVASVADYVFDDGYELTDLEEVHKYIATNRHLPGIPSKSEVSLRGGRVPLGQAFTQMLKKIEELTLYTIHQHQTLNAQKKLLATQQAQIQGMQTKIRSLGHAHSSNGK